jgi:predicted signal transduction protein with EAL and GGDEF domain
MMQNRRTKHVIKNPGKERELKGVSRDARSTRITQVVATMIKGYHRCIPKTAAKTFPHVSGSGADIQNRELLLPVR